MNSELILSKIRSDSEYRDLLDSIRLLGKRGRIRPQQVTGISEGLESYFKLALCGDLLSEGRNALVLFPDDKEAAESADLLSSFGINALKYPSRDFNFNNMTASHEFENERISTLTHLAGYSSDEAFVVCAGIGAALQSTLPLDTISNVTLTIKSESSIDTIELADKLGELGYKKVDLVEGSGQFTIRGGIIDVFVPTGNAYRIELFGDEVDRLGTFDPETQRFGDYCDEVIIPPAREILLSAEKRRELDALINAQIKRVSKIDDLGERARVTELLRREIVDINSSLEVNFIDKYIPALYENTETLLDAFSGSIVLINPLELEKRADAGLSLLGQSITDMLEHYEMPQMQNIQGGYSKEWHEILDTFSKMPTIIIDSISRSYDGISVGAEFDMSSRHIIPYSSRRELFDEDLRAYVDRGYSVAVMCAGETERMALSESLVEEGYSVASGDKAEAYADKSPVVVMAGSVTGGFELPRSRFALLDYSSEMHTKRGGKMLRRSKKKKNTESIMSYADLEVGDFVVHSAYGIGQYMGLQNLTVAGVSRDYVSIKYAGTDQLFLPVEQLDLVSKYIGAGSDSGAVKLSKMGGADWNRAKSKAKAATKEMAKELIELYAKRKRSKGVAFSPDDELCREFAASFEYVETDGQLAAIEDVRRDMEEEYPMDRLVCGDVGYGKTEVALRAAFKAVMSGKQVAILVPTTILAYQHYKTFKRRMRAFPVNIDMISRFRTAGEQRVSVRKLKRGETDIIIGTHRLISNDIEFYDLGLVIIDEEQRFGVAQKEKLKKLSAGVDVLTLTATPIPRTLNMAMGGIVDMSLLDEAPGMRAPVQTYVLEYDEGIIYEAIRRELRRSGQVFYMYNRVEGIYGVASRISSAIPDARIAVAHGKMDKEELEEIWEALIKGEIDILVCTTIIETGVDIPNANTLIIENADAYGLSQLHQIRGRVGRSGRRAYAYFTYKKNKSLTEVSEKRLAAIKEYAQFGAGFKIALRDLEIRGAGNLLGAQQHGHMEAVGYDLYMKLLSEAVIEEQGTVVAPKPECVVDIQADAYLAKNYIPHAPQRMDLYKKIARITCEEDYEDMIDEICDRFGEPSAPAVNLCRIALVRALAQEAGLSKVFERDGTVQLIPYEIHPAVISSLAGYVPQSRMKVTLGAKPTIHCIIPKGQRNTEFLLTLVKQYLKLKNEQ